MVVIVSNRYQSWRKVSSLTKICICTVHNFRLLTRIIFPHDLNQLSSLDDGNLFHRCNHLCSYRSTRSPHVIPKKNPKSLSKSIPSPRDTFLPSFLTPNQVSTLPYPPNVLPGARDVDSPYSIMRCYMWGPEEGRKVILVHGDTTPAPMLGPIAEKLVERACRVLFLC